MDTKQPKNRAAVTLSVAALVISIAGTGGPALASFIYANNSDKVDGKHAVGAGASVANRKGKLVATRGTNGRLPNNIIVKALDADKLDGRNSTRFLKTPVNMRVVAAGTFLDDGVLQEGTGNFTVSFDGVNGRYVVDIPSVNYDSFRYITVATATPSPTKGWVTSDSDGDNLWLTVNNAAGTSIASQVSFVVYDML